MTAPTRQTRSRLMALFSELGLHPRHDLGQNFLIDLNLLEYIVAQAELGPRDVVLEIGAGTGGLTTFLAQAAGYVVSVEVDPRMHALAQAAVAGFENVTLLQTDALHTKNALAPAVIESVERALQSASERRLKLVANLPYSIATPVVSNLVASQLPWELMVVTIQWELAERFRARPGTHDYGALAVWLQSQCDVEILKKLGPQVFWPRPQVDSAIVKVIPDPVRRAEIGNRQFFHDLVRRLFTQRRKRLRGVLREMYRQQIDKTEIEQIAEAIGIAEDARAEQIEVDAFVRLGRALHERLANRSTRGGESSLE